MRTSLVVAGAAAAAAAALAIAWLASPALRAEARLALERAGVPATWLARLSRTPPRAWVGPEPAAPCTVLIGDSLTEGFPAGLADARRWVNRGISGDRISEVAARLDAAALATPCGAIVLLVGTNDIVHVRTSPERAAAAILAVVDRIRGAGKTAVLATLPPVRAPFDPWAGALRATNVRLREEAAKRTDVKLLDLEHALEDAQGQLAAGYSRDGLHLSEAAYARWADALAPLLER
jgi:lysophospholipase L1-like esterase